MCMRSRWMVELMLPEKKPGSGGRFGKPTPHGTISQIPTEYCHLPIVSAIRDPISRYLSAYNYGDWKKNDQLPEKHDKICLEFPNFPELSFKDFLLYLNKYYKIGKLIIADEIIEIGPLSHDFLRFFLEASFFKSNDIQLESWEELNHKIKSITFLKCSNLNNEVYNFLLKNKFEKNNIAHVLEKKPINESKKPIIIAEENMKFIVNQEWLMYKLFPDF